MIAISRPPLSSRPQNSGLNLPYGDRTSSDLIEKKQLNIGCETSSCFMSDSGRARFRWEARLLKSHPPRKSSIKRNPPRDRYSFIPAISSSDNVISPTSHRYANGYLNRLGSLKLKRYSTMSILIGSLESSDRIFEKCCPASG